MKNTIYLFLSIAFFAGCLTEDDTNLQLDSYAPIDINDGLTISTPELENIDASLLAKVYSDVYNDNNLWSLRSLLVFRNGKLVAESYLKDKEDITNRHIIWSCTKQVIGVLTGIAVDQGIINSIDDSMLPYLTSDQALYPDKRNITIKNLLMMQSGIDYNNDEQTDEILRRVPENSIDFILERPVHQPQGIQFHYNDGNPHLLSAIIQNATTVPTDEWADEVLFSKIGMNNYNWVRYKDGITLGGFGIETTPRELSKIALLVANNGDWNGQQIISEAWIRTMIAPQVEIVDSDYSFGYLWWYDTTRGIPFMWGVGGQLAFIIPNKELVIVMTSFPNTKGKYEIQPDEALIVVDKIIDASY